MGSRSSQRDHLPQTVNKEGSKPFEVYSSHEFRGSSQNVGFLRNRYCLYTYHRYKQNSWSTFWSSTIIGSLLQCNSVIIIALPTWILLYCFVSTHILPWRPPLPRNSDELVGEAQLFLWYRRDIKLVKCPKSKVVRCWSIASTEFHLRNSSDAYKSVI